MSTNTSTMVTPTVIDVHQSNLKRVGCTDFTHWVAQPGSLYIGRNLRIGSQHGPISIPKSKWHNPNSLKQIPDLSENLRLYEQRIRTTPDLWNSLGELSGKEMGCWCPLGSPCHGRVLICLFKEKFKC